MTMKFEKIAVIGERELALGFKLIGIKDVFIAEGKEAVKEFLDLVNTKSFNLIMMSESVKRFMEPPTLRIAETSLNPLVVFVPLPGAEKSGESVEALAKRILGVDLKGLKGA